jgi:hypothetical protein
MPGTLGPDGIAGWPGWVALQCRYWSKPQIGTMRMAKRIRTVLTKQPKGVLLSSH